jgi:hypothetical protein
LTGKPGGGAHWADACRRGVLTMNNAEKKRGGWSWWYLLFVVQFIAVLWPPFYNSVEPRWLGIPYFYWYQMLWVIISAVITAVIYLATDD